MKYRKGDVVAVKVILDHDMVPGETYSFRCQDKDIHSVITARYNAGDRVLWGGINYEILHIDGNEAFVKCLHGEPHRGVVALSALERI